jgi:FtsH-binding integral membrane protein
MLGVFAMEPESSAPFGGKFSVQGTGGLIAAIAVVVVLLLWLPAYRLFFLISVLIGVVIAAALTLWHRHKPIRESDVHNPKKPLGLE